MRCCVARFKVSVYAPSLILLRRQAEAEAARESGKRDRAAEIAHMQEAIQSAVMQA